MAGRFPLYTDADIYGPLVHFTLAAGQGRVLVAHDRHQRQIALDWIDAGKPFRGYITWKQKHHQRMSVGDFLEAFEALAAEDDPFAHPIRYITPKH